MAFMDWIPMSPVELGDAGQDDGKRCIWKHGECGRRCTRDDRGHLDTHTHRDEVCPVTGKRDQHVKLVGEA